MASFNATEGSSLFSAAHITALLVIALACIIVPIIYRKSYKRRMRHAAGKRHPAAVVIGLILLLQDLGYYLFHMINGTLTLYMLPLHLCTMAIYIIFIHSLIPADWIGQVLYALCLPGAWCALVFPDWIMYPILTYTAIRCYSVHGLIVVYVIMQVAAGVIRPRLSAIWKPIVFLCVIAPPIMWLNNTIRANYYFLAQPSAGSPLVFLWNLAGGNHTYYILYFAILVLCGMTVMYLPFAIYHKVHG